MSTSSEPDIIHEDAWITIWHHPLPNIVHHKVHQPIRGEAFRRALMKGTEALQRFHASKWLSDDRLHFILPQEDQDWASSTWFPATRQAGWKYWAIVKPELAVADLYMRRLAAEWCAAGVRTELFSVLEPAMKWLTKPDDAAAPSRVPPHRAPNPRRSP